MKISFGNYVLILLFLTSSCTFRNDDVYYDSFLEDAGGDIDYLLSDEDSDEPDLLEAVNIEDENLAWCIKKKLTIPKGDNITLGQLKSISTLSCSKLNYIGTVASLSGLEHAENLQSIYIDNCAIKDLTPLNELTNLREVKLIDCRDIGDHQIASLFNLPYIDAVDFSGSSVITFHEMRFKRFLLALNLSNTLLNTTEYLILMNRLQYLNISKNKSLTELKETTLWGGLLELDISDCSIDSLAGLQYLNALRVLKMGGNRVESVSPLRKLGKLETVDASNNSIRSILDMEQLNSLVNLDISGNYIKDITPLPGLRKLRSLNISENCIDDEKTISLLKSNGVEVIDNGQKPEKCK